MKILWIEDFGGGLNGVQLAESIFQEFLPENALDHDELVEPQLPKLLNQNSDINLAICYSYTDYLKKYESNISQFDLFIIDFNLEKYRTRDYLLPARYLKFKNKFDMQAGKFIYKELVDSGISVEKMAFFTAEAGNVNGFKAFCNRNPGWIAPKYVFEKNANYLIVRKWLSNKLLKLKKQTK